MNDDNQKEVIGYSMILTYEAPRPRWIGIGHIINVKYIKYNFIIMLHYCYLIRFNVFMKLNVQVTSVNRFKYFLNL